MRADFAGRIRKIRQQDQAEAEIIPLRQPAPADDATWQEFSESIEEEKPKHVDKNEYTITENYVIEHPELGGREIAIYCLLVYRAHMPKKTCIASIAGLARRTGWTRNTVAAALDRLIETGCVVRGERQPGGAVRRRGRDMRCRDALQRAGARSAGIRGGRQQAERHDGAVESVCFN